MKMMLAALGAACLFATHALAAPAVWTVDHAKSRLGLTVQWRGEAFNAE